MEAEPPEAEGFDTLPSLTEDQIQQVLLLGWKAKQQMAAKKKQRGFAPKAAPGAVSPATSSAQPKKAPTAGLRPGKASPGAPTVDSSATGRATQAARR